MSTSPPSRPLLVRFAADEHGATAIEYALLAAMLAITAIAGLQALSNGTGGLYDALDAISVAIEDALGQ